MCWLPFVLALVGFGFQAFLNSKQPPQYIAVGKVVVSPSGKPFPVDVDERKRLAAEILAGPEVRRRALERARGIHPELKEIEVAIKATTFPGNWIVKVVAVGDEPIYTRVFLDAVIDETMAVVQERRSKEPQEKPLTETVNITDESESMVVMERPTAALVDYPSVFRGALPSVVLGFGLGLLMALVSAFIAASAATDEPGQV